MSWCGTNAGSEIQRGFFPVDEDAAVEAAQIYLRTKYNPFIDKIVKILIEFFVDYL